MRDQNERCRDAGEIHLFWSSEDLSCTWCLYVNVVSHGCRITVPLGWESWCFPGSFNQACSEHSFACFISCQKFNVLNPRSPCLEGFIQFRLFPSCWTVTLNFVGDLMMACGVPWCGPDGALDIKQNVLVADETGFLPYGHKMLTRWWQWSSALSFHLQVWIFDQPDGGVRLLRMREGHSAPPNFLRHYGNNGHNILSAGQWCEGADRNVNVGQ